MSYQCCDERRRLAVADHPMLNGIDYLEVLDREAPPGALRQRTLLVRFIKAAPALLPENFEITGGARITGIEVTAAIRADDAAGLAAEMPAEAPFIAALPDPEEVIALRTSSSGDYSLYRLHLVASSASLAPPPCIDPLTAHVDFSFKVECPTDFDCAPTHLCPEEPAPAPRIDYLAKDYRSFRRLMLDRMSETLPEWQERNAADLGIALVEMLAYVGDHLSYAQDAVAAEAYLGTARRRVSVRRHARLVDYRMHDGANARVLVQVRVAGGPVAMAAADTKFLTRVSGAGDIVPPAAADPLFDRLLLQKPTVFEPMEDKVLYEELNDIPFHDWGESECCLPKGATRATLRGDLAMLAAGDILVFEERIGPRTGRPADADPAKRWAVRLVQVAAGLEDPVTNPPTPITEIRWANEDALPFPLCLSARTAEEFGGAVVNPVSGVLGNIVVADHGLTYTDVPFGRVPEPHLHLVPKAKGPCDPRERVAVPPRFRPALAASPVTECEALGAPPLPASRLLTQDLRTVTPAITLAEIGAPPGTDRWEARRDLLNSDGDDRHFVVERESDGRAFLRFGDGRHGRRPVSGTEFSATYRIGSGPSGNIGAGAIAHVVTGDGAILGARNPMPAAGGRAAETMEAVRIAAPEAFRVQERAVTPEDYAAIVLRHPEVQRAAATFRWNGHGHTVFVTIDRFGEEGITAAFEAELIAFLDPYRMAGYDLEIDEPRFVSLDIDMLVCVRRDYFRSEVKRAVLETLSDRALADGRLGLFHPDQMSFDEDVYLSRIIAAAQAVEGVESVTVTRFERQGAPDPAPLLTGILPIGRLETARLSNDPNFPEHGRLTLTMGGGK